jgi:excinuclease UvrABC nuclease subunit
MYILPITDSQHLNLDYCAEHETADILLAALKTETRSGCYIFFIQRKALYIGRTSHFFSRLAHHLAKNRLGKKIGTWTTIGVIFSETPHKLERELIRQLKPVFNNLLKSA